MKSSPCPRRVVRGILPALLLLAPVGSVAHAGQPVTCQNIAEDIFKGAFTPQTTVTTDGNSCVFTHLLIKTGHVRNRWSVERLTLTGPELRVRHDFLPPALRVEAHGVVYDLGLEDSHIRYQVALTQKPFDARLDYTWDKASSQFQLKELALESPWIGHVGLTMAVTLPGDRVPDTVKKDDIGVGEAQLVLDNHTLFETFAMPPLIGLIPRDKDPAIEFPRIQRRVERAIGRLPRSFADEASRDALIRFVRDFPHPSGHFEATIRFDQPMGFEDAKADKARELLRQTHVEAHYVPQ